MLTKSKAKEIFFDILEHSGGDFSEDRDEWCYSLNLDPMDVNDFIGRVYDMIDGMYEEVNYD